MKTTQEFNLSNALDTFQAQLSVHGIFTYDNLFELRSHLSESVKFRGEEVSEEEAFMESLESLGSEEELVEGYLVNNQVYIWKNYLWLAALSMSVFAFFSMFSIFFLEVFAKLIFTLNPSVNSLLIKSLMGAGVGLAFLFGIFFFWKNYAEFYKRLISIAVKDPDKVFWLPLLQVIFFVVTACLLSVSKSFDVKAEQYDLIYTTFYVLIILGSIIINSHALWEQFIGIERSRIYRIRQGLGLSFLIGAFIGLLFPILTFFCSIAVSIGIYTLSEIANPILNFLAFVLLPLGISLGIFAIFKFPHLIFPRMLNSIKRNLLGIVLFVVAVVGALYLLSIGGSSMLEILQINKEINILFPMVIIFISVGLFLVPAVITIWTYRHCNNKQAISIG